MKLGKRFGGPGNHLLRWESVDNGFEARQFDGGRRFDR